MPNLGPILIADDDPEVLEAMAELLSVRSYKVLRAPDGEDALRQAQEVRCGAFVTDVRLPGIDGVEVCRKLRAMPEYRITPIIVITGSDDRDVLIKAFAAGCDDFITKPVDPLVLLVRLTAHLQRVEYFEQLDRTRRVLNRFISKRTRDMAETTSKMGGELPPPEQREVVVLFTDIRGFTALAEDIPPEELFKQVSAQLEEQVDLVYEFGGYIDKFGGDGVMAIFDRSDMARQSCLCALRMIAQAGRRAADEDDRMRQLGIGIHMGMAVIGNIGSRKHMDYSVIGTNVNLAARLCGFADRLAIVVSDTVKRAVHDDPRFHFDSGREVTVRGMRTPVTVHNLKPCT